MRTIRHIAIWALTGLLLTACTEPNAPEAETPSVDTTTIDTAAYYPSLSSRSELYRPQVHYSVLRNWTNDPNGLCYKDGTWHLYYQYNPDGEGCDFGNMSWGHASARDLMHWTEHEPVLYPDEMGAMFSGCSVVDTENRAGFGAGAILAYYTASDEKQKICLAVSTDGGMHYRKYAGNPIIPSTGLSNFRDPKVVWDAAHAQYIMVIARGWDQQLEFWRSTDLMHWSFVPHLFHAPEARSNMGQYECPDLIELDGRWVLVLSTMPGGYIHGSGTMYFVGRLTAEGYFETDGGEYPQWLDYGADHYAAVSWNNAPDGRRVAIGWMSNWDYAPLCPTHGWKTAFCLPREYSLREIDGRQVLCANPVAELESLAGEPQAIADSADLQHDLPHRLEAYELRAEVSLAEDAAIRLTNAYGEYYEVRIDHRCRKIICDRSKSGQRHFSSLFAVPSMSAPIRGDEETVTLRLIVDQSSVELFADSGATCVTNVVYPRALYTRISTSGAVQDLQYRELETIW